jgi:uncharacterized C2H2 Zn-finger protein
MSSNTVEGKDRIAAAVGASTKRDAARTFLTLGDGDFSWSADLAAFLATAAPQQSSPLCTWPTTNRLVATGIDTLDDLRSKYTDYDSIVKKMLRMGSAHFRVEVKHEINAIDRILPAAPQDTSSNNDEDGMMLRADVVIFNHPHLGTEDASLHGCFLHHLFDAVNNTWMKKHGIFIVTLADGQFERWRCEEAANTQKFRLLEKRCFVPNALLHDSAYELRRHQTGKSFRARTCGSFSFIYARRDDADSSIETIKDLPWFQPLGGDDDKQTVTKPMKPSDAILFTCPYCDRVFREERSVQNHISSKHGGINMKRKLECTLCKEPRIFDCEEALRDHQRAKHLAMHDTIKPDWAAKAKESSCSTTIGQCTICGIHFTSTFGHIEHMAAFLPQSPRAFLCQFCAKTLGSLRAKKQHENYCSASSDQVKTIVVERIPL